MISFDLRCSHGHVFEGWFRTGADYEDQNQRQLIQCPVCGDGQITKAVMAPNVAAKGNRLALAPPSAPPAPAPHASEAAPADGGAAPAPVIAAPALAALPPEAVALLAAVAQAQAEALPQSRWVGRRFADEARALHSGSETGAATIHGQATREEVDALMEEGIAVMPLLVPVVPPEQRN